MEIQVKENRMNSKVSAGISRLDYIDVFRSLGILAMIMGHIGFGGRFDYFIHAFHIPMFFFISGFFIEKKVVVLVST